MIDLIAPQVSENVFKPQTVITIFIVPVWALKLFEASFEKVL